MEMFGISNVIDCVPILNKKDGIADGFVVKFVKERTFKAGKKILTKQVEAEKTVWIREFDPNSVKSDGILHGFGNGIIFKKSSSKPKKHKTITVSKEVYNKIVGIK